MTWFPFILSIATTALIAVLMLAIPSVTRSTLPLGVSVPQARVQEPVIGQSVRRYRIAVIGGFVLAMGVGAAVAGLGPVFAALTPTLIVTVLAIGAYVFARTRIIRAKKDGNWYENVPVRLTADIAATGRAGAGLPFGWYLAAAVGLVSVVAVGAVLYPTLPDTIPTHWDGAGEVNASAPKSIWSVFGPVMIGLALVIVMLLVSLLVRISPLRSVASDSPEESLRRAHIQRRLLNSLVGQLALIITLMLAAISLLSWQVVWINVPLVVIALIVLIAFATLFFVLRFRWALATPAQDTAKARPDSPDDDRYWKGGLIYINRNDPALLVPKRFGIGWSVNVGNPVGIAILLGLVVVIVAAIVVFAVSR